MCHAISIHHVIPKKTAWLSQLQDLQQFPQRMSSKEAQITSYWFPKLSVILKRTRTILELSNQTRKSMALSDWCRLYHLCNQVDGVDRSQKNSWYEFNYLPSKRRSETSGNLAKHQKELVLTNAIKLATPELGRISNFQLRFSVNREDSSGKGTINWRKKKIYI